MKIGIDISQIAYSGTGVAVFVRNTIEQLIIQNPTNDYVLFGSSLRNRHILKDFSKQLQSHTNVNMKLFPFPPTLLDIVWNRWHILPIELFIGNVDVFISSDWTQPPTRAKNVTILYDLIVYLYPKETATKIINVQKRKLKWVVKEADCVLCISYATKKDAIRLLNIDSKKLHVVYPGL